MPFVKSFVDKRPEIVSGGWDFSATGRDFHPFIFGGLFVEPLVYARGTSYTAMPDTPRTAVLPPLT